MSSVRMGERDEVLRGKRLTLTTAYLEDPVSFVDSQSLDDVEAMSSLVSLKGNV
jgi:hypothetical protein